jgi:hypothetical protein
MNTVYRGPSIYASYQISVHLAKRFQRRLFIRNQLIRNKNCLYRPCLWTDQDEIGNLHGTNMVATAIFFSDWPISKNSSHMKLFGTMHRNLVGCMYGRSSMQIAYFQELSITAMEILHRISDFREKICIRDRLTRNKNWLSRPCLLTDRTKMNTVYRGPSWLVDF